MKGIFSKQYLHLLLPILYSIVKESQPWSGSHRQTEVVIQNHLLEGDPSHFLTTSAFPFCVASAGDADQVAYRTPVRIPGRQDSRLQLGNRQTCLIPTPCAVSWQQPGCQMDAESVWHWAVDRFILRGSYEICLPIIFLKFTTNSLKT